MNEFLNDRNNKFLEGVMDLMAKFVEDGGTEQILLQLLGVLSAVPMSTCSNPDSAFGGFILYISSILLKDLKIKEKVTE